MEGFPFGLCGCGARVLNINGVYQFTGDVPVSTDTNGLMWLGYEQVGENYEPGYIHNKEADVIGRSDNLASFLGEEKVVLDIGAGLGASAISFALAGLRVIAADISQVMLESAAKRANFHGVPVNQIVFARMNGYHLPLADNSIDAVLEVDMLHQVNRPEIVMKEILRVLKPDGCFLQYSMSETVPPYTDEQHSVNTKYNQTLQDIQDYYNKTLTEAGYTGPLFSAWEQAGESKKKNFTLFTTLADTGCYDNKNTIWTLKKGLHKTKTRAAGAKQLIPADIHNHVWAKTDTYARNKYGDNYEDIYRYYTNRSCILVYKKKNRVEILRNYIDDILLHMDDTENRRCAYLHLYGVSLACALIALKRGENVELATMAGMLHDLHTYKTGNHQNHAVLGALLAKEVLGQLQITTPDETAVICSAIHNHSTKTNTFSSFDEVLLDADVMQHVLYNYSAPVAEHEKGRFANLVEEFSLNTTPKK
jgi:uncharacterized protein